MLTDLRCKIDPPEERKSKIQKPIATCSYETTENTLSRCAIAYLLKNDCQVNDLEENSKKFADRIYRKQKEIERLEAKLVSRLPKGRDLTGEEFLETLTIATGQVPENEGEQLLWQAKLLAKPATLPYPIVFGSQDDLRWSMNEKGRLCVAFNGIEKFIPELKQTPFQIYCDQRQLPIFEKFLQDWQAHRANKETYPLSLFLLQTASLGWEQGKGKGAPWTVNRLTLHCTIDSALLTAEGTEQLRQQAIAKLTTQLSEVADWETLTEPQQAHIKRQRSSLVRLQKAPQRPSKPQYQGRPEIMVGVSIGLACPITAAVVNLATGQALTYRSTRQLLENDYRLLNRQRRQQQHNTLKRHQNQVKGHSSQPSESELGQHVDRLLANSIVNLAQQFQASCIVLPQTKHLREHLLTEINAKAQKKSDSKQVQDKYAKEFRMSIHRWSYDRLLTTISSQAEKIGCAIETIAQPLQGTPQQKAKDVAIAAYHFRQVSSN
jgi:IS605 OrfB family transposase